MKQRRYWFSPVIFLLLSLLGLGLSVQAQPTCRYATLRLETRMPVDVEAICQAARPWSSKGIRVLIFLTDHRPAGEADWLALLDQVNAEAGFQDPDQPGSLLKNSLAIQASTDTNLNWAQTIRLGARFDNTPLATNPNLIAQIKSDWQTDIALGNPSRAVVDALTEAYQAAYPPSSSWLWGVVAMVVLSCLGAAAFTLGPKYLQPLLARRQVRQGLQAHLVALRAQASNLLDLLDRLLAGERPEATVLYQLFNDYGGEQDADLRRGVLDALNRARRARDEALDRRWELFALGRPRRRDLEDVVRAWEAFYLTLTGSSEQILTLSDSELQALLDPFLTLTVDAEAPSALLTAQFAQYQRDLVEMALKVDFLTIDPAEVETAGILNEIAYVKGKIAFLKYARQESPRLVERARERRQELEPTVLPNFLVTTAELFDGIDARLTRAETALKREEAVVALDQAEAALHDLETVQVCLSVMAEHQRIRARIDTMAARGYRPPSLPETLQEIETDLRMIAGRFRSRDYESVSRWTEELRLDDQRALKQLEDWQLLEQANAMALKELQARLSQTVQYHTSEARPAWQALQSYPEANRADLADVFAAAAQMIHDLADRAQEIGRLNGLSVQAFAATEQQLDQAFADLAWADQWLREVVHRLAEVRAAAQRVPVPHPTEADSTQNLIVVVLTIARFRLTEAPGVPLNHLFDQLDRLADQAEARMAHMKRQLDGLPAAAQTGKTNAAARLAIDTLAQARQARLAACHPEGVAPADALAQAVVAFEIAIEQIDLALIGIAEDRGSYGQLFSNVQEAIREARATIRQAEFILRRPEAGEASHETLQEAKNLLPGSPGPHQSLAALRRILNQAQDTHYLAQRAETLARQRIEAEAYRRQGRRRLPPLVIVAFPMTRPQRAPHHSRPPGRTAPAAGNGRRSAPLTAARRAGSADSRR